MHYEDREKNPFFLPSFIMVIIPVVLLFVFMGRGYLMIFVTPYVALILSVAGLITALNRSKRFIGCVFCLVLSLVEVLLVISMPAYMSGTTHYHDHEHMDTIVPHTLSSEQIAERESIRESINEIINHSIRSNTVTGDSK